MRPRGTGSVYQRPGHDARWHLKYYDARGKPHYESATTRAEAERLLRRRLGEVAEGRRLVGRERERTTFDDLERLIIDDYRLRRRKSLDSVMQSFRALRREFGGRRACDISYDDLVHYAAQRRTDGRADATVRRELVLLHRSYVLALRVERVTDIPPFPPIEVDNAREGYFEDDAYEAVRGRLAPHLQDVVDFFHWTAWRLMEVLKLRWQYVDFDAGTITLPWRATKNRRARPFPFRDFPELAELLGRRYALTATLQRADGRITPWVFHDDEGEPFFGADDRRPKRSFRRAWRRACVAAGQPGRQLHDFRRTAIRNFRRVGGMSESEAMALSGHRTASIFRRYDIISDDDVSEAVKRYAARRRLPKRLPSGA
jgi:integrase